MQKILINPTTHFSFSAGETHLRAKLTDSEDYLAPVIRGDTPILLDCRDYTPAGFMALCEYAQVLRRAGVPEVHVRYPYLPYARQDRVIHPDEPFSLKLFCEMLNAQKFDSVTIWDPHSDVAPALIERVRVVEQYAIAERIVPLELFAEVILVSPDAGAYKKVSKLANGRPVAIGLKARGDRGAITDTQVLSPVPLGGAHCLIVDDICDGGRTFIELGKALKSQGAAKVSLYVTHGIFSKGVDVLRLFIDDVYSTDSFPAQEGEEGYVFRGKV